MFAREATESDREVEAEEEEEPDVVEAEAEEDVSMEEYGDVVEEVAKRNRVRVPKESKGACDIIERKSDGCITCRDYRRCGHDDEFIVSHAQLVGRIAQCEQC